MLGGDAHWIHGSSTGMKHKDTGLVPMLPQWGTDMSEGVHCGVAHDLDLYMRVKMSGGALVMSERMHGLECQINRHDQWTN